MSRRSTLPPDEVRQNILEAAERLFREVGYSKTTIADIAAALGMSSANVYRFFPSKSAINNEICSRMTAALSAEMHRAAGTAGTAAERLATTLLAANALHQGMFTNHRRVHEMVDVAMSENWEAIEAHLMAMEAILADVIADGIRDGEFGPGDPAGLAGAALQACCSLIHPTLVAQCAEDPDRESDTRRLIWLVIEGLRNPNRSPMP
jgi:AcrR family transcriptional regulator